MSFQTIMHLFLQWNTKDNILNILPFASIFLWFTEEGHIVLEQLEDGL